MDLAGGDDERSAALLGLAIAGCEEAGGSVRQREILTRKGARVRAGEFDDGVVEDLARALTGVGGLLVGIPGDLDAIADLVDEALISLGYDPDDDLGPLYGTIVGVVGVGGEDTGDLSSIDRIWEALTEAGALVLPGAVVIDGSKRSFDSDGQPLNQRHKLAAQEVGASVARLVRRMGL